MYVILILYTQMLQCWLELKNFIPCLQDHLLAHLLGLSYDGNEYNFSDEDWDCINIMDNQIYFHQTLSVNYMTYNLQHEQDTINPLSRLDIIVLSQEDKRTHSYWYAWVVHIFHVFVQVRENMYSPFSHPIQMNVLFIRWFGRDINYLSG